MHKKLNGVVQIVIEHLKPVGHVLLVSFVVVFLLELAHVELQVLIILYCFVQVLLFVDRELLRDGALLLTAVLAFVLKI